MKQLINNHVHCTQLATVTNNEYAVAPAILSGFGFLPKYEITPLYTLVVEYEPRGGVKGMIFTSMKYFCPSRLIQGFRLGSNTDMTQWKGLFPWRHTLGWIIRGCRIRNERTDTFTICHSTNSGMNVYCYHYSVCITATIVPERFYAFMKSGENVAEIRATIENCVQDIIAEELRMRAGNPVFVLHTQFASTKLELAGYSVTDCRIQYN